MQLTANKIHIWTANLALSPDQERQKFALLNEEERVRALRFHFPIHRRRFIAARGILREILSQYVGTKPEALTFAYAAHQKPSLQSPSSIPIQFNLAHSDELAVYAVTLDHAIGIDIEKMKPIDREGIATRFFSKEENASLAALAEDKRRSGFYRLWSRKEAVIKAIGKGLHIALSSFTVSLNDDAEKIHLENDTWSLHSLSLHPDYQAALASNHKQKCDILYFYI